MFDLENLEEKEVKNLNPQVLAFVGDGVYSLYIRHKVILTEGLKTLNTSDRSPWGELIQNSVFFPPVVSNIYSMH